MHPAGLNEWRKTSFVRFESREKRKIWVLSEKVEWERKQKSGSDGKRELERSLTVLLKESYQSVAWLLEAQFRHCGKKTGDYLPSWAEIYLPQCGPNYLLHFGAVNLCASIPDDFPPCAGAIFICSLGAVSISFSAQIWADPFCHPVNFLMISRRASTKRQRSWFERNGFEENFEGYWPSRRLLEWEGCFLPPSDRDVKASPAVMGFGELPNENRVKEEKKKEEELREKEEKKKEADKKREERE